VSVPPVAIRNDAETIVLFIW